MKLSQGGFTLAEFMTAIAIGGIMSLAMAAVFTFSVQQFNSLIDQNEAEESLLLASFYLRAVVSQAVKTFVTPAAAPDPTLNWTAIPDNPLNTPGLLMPAGVAKGYFRVGDTSAPNGFICDAAGVGTAECQNGGHWGTPPGTAAAGSIQTLAIFVRENGAAANPAQTTSQYVSTGIFYRTPNGAQPGKLYIAQAPNTGLVGGFSVTDTFPNVANSIANGMTFDRFVAFGISSTNPPNCTITGGIYNGTLQCVNLFLRTRYFKGVSQAKNYSPNQATAAAAGALFRDIDMTVNINFRNNILRDPTESVSESYERVYTGIYFYRFQAPNLSDF